MKNQNKSREKEHMIRREIERKKAGVRHTHVIVTMRHKCDVIYDRGNSSFQIRLILIETARFRSK